jgi:hypothetical protein
MFDSNKISIKDIDNFLTQYRIEFDSEATNMHEIFMS